MTTLKFRSVIGKELEIEGEERVVLELIGKYFTPQGVSNAGGQSVDNLSTSLNSVVVRVRPKVEAEWVLLYAYYLNKPQFSRADLLESYRTSQRYSQNRRKNLSFNLKVAIKKGWFNAISANVFSLSPDGMTRASEILERTR